MSYRRVASWLAFAACGALGFACSSTDSVDPGYQNLGGSGGGGGGGGDGGSGASSSSSSGHTSSSSSSSSSGSSSSGSSSSSSSSSSGMPCPDPGIEPNETEATAVDLGGISDNDSDAASVSGVLDSVDDVDWYKYHGDDTFGYVVDPTRGLTTPDNLRLCAFFDCDDGSDAAVTCNGGATSAQSPDGRPGCCHSQGFTADIDCSSSDDSAEVFIRLDKPVPACVTYDLMYHY